MLPLALLNIKRRRGRIYVSFLSDEHEELASLMIEKFNKSIEYNATKGSLDDEIKALEYQYDYRIVRGLYIVLERLCKFKSKAEYYGVDPMMLRRRVFEESSRRGYALTEYERLSILESVAKHLGMDVKMVEDLLLSDLPHNMLIVSIENIDPHTLIALYNLSLIQTLLFRCIRLECTLKDGADWKYLLRGVKRLGLMYTLEYNDSMKCIIEGPLSLFKLTDMYGTSIAKLVPTIVRAKEWNIKAWTVSNDKSKSYEFILSSNDGINIYRYEYDEGIYDSSIEERFANTFINYRTGWSIRREPEPLIAGGRAFIPDFVFEKGALKVYLEIVGFWTKDYLARKLEKIRELKMNNGAEMLIAIDKTLASSMGNIPITESCIILFDTKDGIPVAHVVNHLKKIENKVYYTSVDTKVLESISSMVEEGIPVIDLHDLTHSSNDLIQGDKYKGYTKVRSYLISNSLLEYVRTAIDGIGDRLSDAYTLLKEYGVPEECYIDVLSLLGYDIIWNSIDVNDAVIVKRRG
jgi:predicted nuclease of restriction endonuclease-like RecB superfamily